MSSLYEVYQILEKMSSNDSDKIVLKDRKFKYKAKFRKMFI